MPRAVPVDRFAQLIARATQTFVARGYRLTQMADIAEALGVAKGTLYGYVESKEALFDAAVRFADGHLALPEPAQLPLKTPTSGATIAYIRERIWAEAGDMVLVQVVSKTRVIRDPRKELAAVLSDLYRRIARNRLALKLVDRCASDYPELARVWFGEGRGAQQQLLIQLLQTRAGEQRYRRLDNPDVVARAMLETIAFWAMHRHFDPSPQAVDDAAAERAIIDFIVHGVLRGST
ncbi:MAG: helix-turn-helix domain-containing protein [Deltaproteobacteria bacterium]